MKSLIIASTSTIHGGTPLEYLMEELKTLFHNTDKIVFVPFARPGGVSYDDYTSSVSTAFKAINKRIIGIHEFDNQPKAIKEAQGIFVGGGNTFVLVNQLYKSQILEPLKVAIESGTPYLGTSAGSNICGLTMSTTNDMPIIYPPSFKTLGVVPFNINPHYLDPDVNSKHMGETRETRIKEFHTYNSQPVIGLREGSWIEVEGRNITLRGNHRARIFNQGKSPHEIDSNSDLGFLK